MKLTTTTSSLLLASMALSSPSLSVAAPTGMEAPTSPNPAGTPNIRQFPRSPIFDDSVVHSPSKRHAPAFRTGPGSPRRSIPSRMIKVSKRQSLPDMGNLEKLWSSLLGPVNALSSTLGDIPIIGGLLGTSAHAQVNSATVDSLPDVNHITNSLSGFGAGLGLPLPVDVGRVIGKPFNDPLEPVNGPLAGVEGFLGGTVPGIQQGPELSSIPQLPQIGSALPPTMIYDNGIWKEVFGNPFAVESAPVSAATGLRPSTGVPPQAPPPIPAPPIPAPERHAQTAPAALAFQDGAAIPHPPSGAPTGTPSPGAPVRPPPVSQLPVHPSATAVPGSQPPHPSVAAAAVSSLASDFPVHPAAPTGAAAPPNIATHADPSIQTTESQPGSSVHPPVPSSVVHAVSRITLGATTPVGDASLTGLDGFGSIRNDVDGLSGSVPELIHGMSAP